MIKLWMSMSYLSLVAAAFSMANEQENLMALQGQDRIYYLPQITQEEIQQFFEKPEYSSILICPEGTELPISYFLKGGLIEGASAAESDLKLVIKQTFYLRFQEQQVLISLDGETWKTWEELLTGTFSITLDVQSGTPRLQLGTEMHLR